MKKQIIFALLSLLLLSACNRQETIESPSVPELIEVKPTTYKIPEIIDQIVVEGRSQTLEDSITMDYSGSGIRFCYEGQGTIKAKLMSTENRFDFSDDGRVGRTLFSIYLDGQRMEKNIVLDNDYDDVTLLTDVPYGTHEVMILRQTNVYMSIANLYSITIEGSLLPCQKKERFIEYIGDSYTTGYSLQGPGENGYDTDLDDPLEAYAFQSAKNLGVDYSLVAYSGAGFAFGYTDFTVPEVYPYLNYFRDEETYYTPNRMADLAIVNLGTNDVAKVGFYGSRKEVKEGVATLVGDIYTFHGEIPIAFLTDATHENNDSLIQEALKENFPETEFNFIYLSTNDGAYNGHPSKECGNRQGMELADSLRELYPDLF